ncbi:hypothetical protein M3175_17720 [Robertmurraya korlensis]|nr:hypothetical protein [Robertmurraya korlensis]
MENLKPSIIISLSLVFLIWMFLSQVTNLNSFASSYDQVDFALALERYDLLAMQPHFPGYPYFILGGYLVHLWVQDKAASLTVFNILLYTSAIIPMYKLSRTHFSGAISVLVASLTYCSGFVVLMVNQPMSEGAAIAVLWWYVWSIHVAWKKQSFLSQIIPLFLLSILLGIRLSYLPFAIGVLFLFYKLWKKKQLPLKDMLSLGLLAILFQLLWVSGVAFTEGGFVDFMKLALSFTSGHFNEWGGTATRGDQSFFSRVYQLIIVNIGWIGIGIKSFFLLSMFAIMLLYFFRAISWKRIKTNDLFQLLTLLIVVYFLWVLFAQNVEKPRHIIPLITLGTFSLFSMVFSKWKTTFMIVFSLLLLSVQAYQTTLLLKEQASVLPATYQLGAYLENYKEPFVLYAWEESRVFTYLDTSFPHKEINTYSKFLHDQSYYKNKDILLTNSVLEGFISQGIDLTGKVEVVEEFSSNSLFDPVYHHIILYRWKGGRYE